MSLMVKGQNLYSHMVVCLEGQEYHLSYNNSHIHIDYEGRSYYFSTDKNKKIIDMAIGDIDSNGNDNLLILEGENLPYGQDFVIYDILTDSNGLELKEKYRNHMEVVRPWKIKACELDQDQELEIFIAVNKKTQYYEEIENRPFFFNFRNDMLVKKWTGSKVRASFTDVYFADLNGNGRDEFIVVEESEEGGFVVAVYYWFGFGFILQGESENYDRIELVGTETIDKNTFLVVETWNHKKKTKRKLEPSKEQTKNGVYLLKEREEWQ